MNQAGCLIRLARVATIAIYIKIVDRLVDEVKY